MEFFFLRQRVRELFFFAMKRKKKIEQNEKNHRQSWTVALAKARLKRLRKLILFYFPFFFLPQAIMDRCFSENSLESDAIACIAKYQAKPADMEPYRYVCV